VRDLQQLSAAPSFSGRISSRGDAKGGKTVIRIHAPLGVGKVGVSQPARPIVWIGGSRTNACALRSDTPTRATARARKEQTGSTPRAGSCQTAKDDGSKRGVRYLARSNRGAARTCTAPARPTCPSGRSGATVRFQNACPTWPYSRRSRTGTGKAAQAGNGR